MTDLKPIRPAATVVVCRDGEKGLELLMLKRSSKSTFMASVMVYPGGALDAADSVVAESPRVRASREVWERDLMKALAIASLRECFEETGLLCASFEQAPSPEMLGDLRAKLLSSEMSFEDVLAQTRAVIDLEDVWYFARWVTPNWETKRYDARFFLVESPRNQLFSFDKREADAGDWYTPQEALDAYQRGEMILSPPTWATLTDLKSCSTVEEAKALARVLKPSPILPHFTDVEGGKAVLLPGDASYPVDLDHQVDTAPRVPPSRTRIGFENNRWVEL